MTDTSEEPNSSTGANTPMAIQRNLTIKPFLKQTDSHDTALQWQRYKKDIDRQFRFFGITDPDTKKDGLLICGGQDLVDIDEALPDPTRQDSDNAYTLLIRKIDSHFIPKKNKDFARFQFHELKQNTSERLADYYAKQPRNVNIMRTKTKPFAITSYRRC
jgi:hypothetical protein